MSAQISKIQSGRLSEYARELWLNIQHSDVTFLIENEELPAHRLILASREYFHTLLYGPYAESTQKAIKLEGPAAPFKALLKYIYFDHIVLSEMKLDEIIEVMGLARMYNFSELTASIEKYIEKNIISMDTVGSIMKLSAILHLDSVIEISLKFLDQNASNFVKHDSFAALSPETLCSLLKRDTFEAPEEEIFLAVQNWSMDKSVAERDMVVAMVRLPLMAIGQLLNIVQPSGLVQDNLIHNAMREKISFDKKHNAVNLASETMGAEVTRGKDRRYILKNNTRFCWQNSKSSCKAITVKLGSMNRINHIQLLLAEHSSHEDGSFQYSVYGSADDSGWTCLVNHKEYRCRSWQYLYFPSCTLQYIRLVGTGYIAVQSLKAFHVEDVPYLLNGFVVPKDNAATYDRGATVVTGENGKELLYDSNTMMPTTEGDRTEYTSHKIGDNGMILLRFGQPYYIESIRLLLCEKNNRTYRFYVETSVDENNWEMAVDMRNTDVNSSLKSIFSFNKRLVLWMKIVGTECSIKDEKEFRCIRFMSPAYPCIKSSTIKRKRAHV